MPAAQIPLTIALEELVRPASSGLRQRLKDLPLARAVHRKLTRNVLLAMGNSRLQRFKPLLESYASDPDPILSEQARWSLLRLER
jgi:epoxyqueuosine reductase QueG